MEKDTADSPREHGEKKGDRSEEKDAPEEQNEGKAVLEEPSEGTDSLEDQSEKKDVLEEDSEEKDVLEDHITETEIGEHDITECVQQPGHSECLRTKLQGFPVDKRFTSGQTLLFKAAKNGFDEYIEILADAGANLTATDFHCNTALNEAVLNNQAQCVAALIRERADVNFVEPGGRHALLIAAEKGYRNCVDELTKGGADVNYADVRGDTPLKIACRNLDMVCLDMLVKAGADVNLDKLSKYEELKILEPFLTASELNDRLMQFPVHIYKDVEGKGKTALMEAVKCSVDCIDFLVKAGANVNVQTTIEGTTALLEATKAKLECIPLLLEAGADVNVIDKEDVTPLMSMVMRGDEGLEYTKFLYRAGADVNQANKKRTTALMQAAMRGHTQWIRLLVEMGADVNGRDIDNRTPLMLAAENGYLTCIEDLLNLGADANVIDRGGKTPLMWAALSGHTDCMSFLINRSTGADVNMKNMYGETALACAAMCGGHKCVTLLLEAGADVNVALTSTGVTPLMLAAEGGHHKSVQSLIEAGADVNRVNSDADGMTALMFAAKGQSSTFHILIDSYANRGDSKLRTTPLKTAADLRTIRLLLKSGAKINKINRYGDNALMSHMKSKSSVNKHICMLLYAAGESTEQKTLMKPPTMINYRPSRRYRFTLSKTKGPTPVKISEYIEQGDLSLRHLARTVVRRYMMDTDPHAHLFGRVPQLETTNEVKDYLLYDVKL